MGSPAFAEDIAAGQRKLVARDYRLALPDRPNLRWYAATGSAAEVIRGPQGWVLKASAAETPAGIGGEALAWALTRPAFSLHEMVAQHPHIPEHDLRQALDLLVRIGVYAPCDPPAL
jgi:hypothetical protein